MKKKGSTGYVYDFSVDYRLIAVNDIKNIHKYLMEKNNIAWSIRACLKYTSCKVKYKIYVFIKKVFHIGSLFLSSLLGTTSLSCISMNNQKCKVRPEIINVNSNEPVFYPFSIKISKCSGSCNNINDPMRKYVFLML